MKIGSTDITAAYLGSTSLSKVYVGSTEVWSAVDPDAQAFITAAGITDATQQEAINTLVVDLKGYGIWSKMKALYPFVGGSASSHKYNLKDPRDLDAAFRLVFNGGWTHSSTGATPNGTNGYADTRFNGSTHGTLSNEHVSFYSRTNAGNKAIIGASDGADETNIYPNLSGVFYYRVQKTNSGTSGLNLNAQAFFMANRTDSANVSGFRNSTKYTISNAVGNKVNRVYFVGANNNVLGTAYATNECAFASIGDGLSDTEASNLYTAVQAFQTSLSRQV